MSEKHVGKKITIIGVALIALCSWAAQGAPVPGFNRATAPLTSAGSTVGIRSSSPSRSGYMSASQASDLALVLSGAFPTPTPSPADPLLFYGGRVYSTGVIATYFSDTFSRADVANINGTAIQTGGVNWQVHNIGTGAALTETVGVTSHVLQCTANCSGAGGYGDPGIVIDTSRSDVAVSATLPTYPLLTFNLFGLRLLPATGSSLAFPSGFYVYNSAFTSLNHICIGGFGAGAPGETCGAGFSSSASPVIVTASISGNTITVTLSGLSAPSVSVTSAYQNTATIHGVALQHSVSAPGFTNFAVTSPLVPKSLNMRGYYANGTDTATLTVGEDANSGTGGAEYSDTTHAPFAVDLSQLTSAVPVGTPPLVITSTTKVVNLNSDLLDGQDSTAFATAAALAAHRGYITLVGFLGVTNGSSDSGKLTVDTNALTPRTCTVEVEALGVGAGTCVYSLYDVTTTTLLCSVSLACNSSTTTTGTCTASGTAAASDVLSFRATSPSVGNTTAAQSTLTCSVTQ